MLDQSPESDLLPPAETPERETSNRTFLIVVGILGGLVLLTILGVILYAFVLGPRLSASSSSARATAEAYNQQIAQAMTATMNAAQSTATAQVPPQATATQLPTGTAVVNLPAETATSIYDPLTATMEALYTQAAIAQTTPTSTLIPPAELPEGGFADGYGLPGLLVIAVLLVATIFLARRLRAIPSQ